MEQKMFTLFGKKIKMLRKSKNITQQELATLLNCSRLSIIQIESGKKDISVTQLIALSKIFNVPSCQIISTIEDCEAYTQKITHIKKILNAL